MADATHPDGPAGPLPTAGRGPADDDETRRANRAWWDDNAREYLGEHGTFLGVDDLVWGPEGWTEDDLRLLDPLGPGTTALEIGCGAAQGARYVARRGARVVATDLSGGMLATARDLDGGSPLPYAQCDATCLPFADEAFDLVFTAYGAIGFVADSGTLFAECARVLRPGGRLVASVSHPFRWALPDVPGEDGLVVRYSYFDRTPYVERDGERAVYAEHHRTVGDRVRDVVDAGLVLDDLIEPEWPARNEQTWGGWSPLRGRLIPGTLVLVCHRP